MPVANRPGQQPPTGYTSGQHLPGATPSGRYDETKAKVDDRTLLLVSIGVAALLLIIILAVLLTRGGGSESGYSEGVRSNFVDTCAETVSRSSCECYIDRIAESVPFEDFDAWESAIAEDPAAETPDAIQSEIDACNDQA